MDKQKLDSLNSINQNWSEVDEELKKVIKKEKKKILLINPPQFQTSFIDLEILKNKRYFNYPPYGLGLLRKSLVEKGYEVKILDLNFELLSLANNFIKNPENLNSYMKSYEIKASDNKNYLNYEYDEKSFKLLDNQTIQAIPIEDLMLPKLNELILSISDRTGLTPSLTPTI